MVLSFSLTQVCYYFLDTSTGVTLLENIGLNLGDKLDFQDFYDARDLCRQNNSLITVVSDLKIIDSDTQQLNLTVQIKDALDGQNWQQLVMDQDFRYILIGID
jgi:hypothetical protein